MLKFLKKKLYSKSFEEYEKNLLKNWLIHLLTLKDGKRILISLKNNKKKYSKLTLFLKYPEFKKSFENLYLKYYKDNSKFDLNITEIYNFRQDVKNFLILLGINQEEIKQYDLEIDKFSAQNINMIFKLEKIEENFVLSSRAIEDLLKIDDVRSYILNKPKYLKVINDNFGKIFLFDRENINFLTNKEINLKTNYEKLYYFIFKEILKTNNTDKNYLYYFYFLILVGRVEFFLSVIKNLNLFKNSNLRNYIFKNFNFNEYEEILNYINNDKFRNDDFSNSINKFLKELKVFFDRLDSGKITNPQIFQIDYKILIDDCFNIEKKIGTFLELNNKLNNKVNNKVENVSEKSKSNSNMKNYNANIENSKENEEKLKNKIIRKNKVGVNKMDIHRINKEYLIRVFKVKTISDLDLIISEILMIIKKLNNNDLDIFKNYKKLNYIYFSNKDLIKLVNFGDYFKVLNNLFNKNLENITISNFRNLFFDFLVMFQIEKILFYFQNYMKLKFNSKEDFLINSLEIMLRIFREYQSFHFEIKFDKNFAVINKNFSNFSNLLNKYYSRIGYNDDDYLDIKREVYKNIFNLNKLFNNVEFDFKNNVEKSLKSLI